jgi:hypothetical protein
MLDDLIPLFAITFSVGLPLTIPIVYLVLNYRKRLRLMELHHAERMAAIERGMEIPPLPIDLIDGRSPVRRRRRTSLLAGLVWFFVGLAVLIGVRAIDHGIPIISGLIPLAVGLAYLIYYFAEGRKLELQDWDRQSLEPHNDKAIERVGNIT